MSQVHFEQVTSWQGAKLAHERFVTDYNAQPHWAHQKRDDNRLSPSELLGQETGRLRYAPRNNCTAFSMPRGISGDEIGSDMRIFGDGNSIGKRRWLVIPP